MAQSWRLLAAAVVLLAACLAAAGASEALERRQVSPNHVGDLNCPQAAAGCRPKTVTRCISVAKKITKTVRKTVTSTLKKTTVVTASRTATVSSTTTTFQFILGTTTVQIGEDQITTLPSTVTVSTTATTSVILPDQTLTVTGDPSIVVTETVKPTLTVTSTQTDTLTFQCQDPVPLLRPLPGLARRMMPQDAGGAWSELPETNVADSGWTVDTEFVLDGERGEREVFAAPPPRPGIRARRKLRLRSNVNPACPACTSLVRCTRTTTKTIKSTMIKKTTVTKTSALVSKTTVTTSTTVTGQIKSATSTLTVFPDTSTSYTVVITTKTRTSTLYFDGTVVTVTESNSGTTITETTSLPPVITTVSVTTNVTAKCTNSPRTTTASRTRTSSTRKMTTTDLPIAPPPPPPLPKASTTKSRTRTRTQTSTSRTTRTATTSYTATKTCSVVPDGNGSTSGPNGTSILENDSPITPPGVDFTANTGGDGWDVGFTDDEARVINVYHHKVPMRVDCFLRDGTRCPGGFPTQFPGIVTSLQSRVMWDPVVPNRLWQWTMSNSSGVGYNSVTCVDLGALGSVPVLCGNFRMSRDQYGSRPGFGGSNQGPVGQPIVGTKIYAINNVDGFGLDDERNALHCFDTATMEPCPENPIPVKYPTGWRQQSVNTAWTRLIRGKIYIFQPGRTNVDYDLIACVDPNNDPSYECGGLWPVKVPAGAQSNGNTYSDLFPYRTSATIDSGVCIGGAMGVNASSPSPACFDLSGNFIKQLNTNFSPGLRWPGVSGDLLGTKIILPCGSGVCCFDMATDATCPNYPAYGFAPSSEIKDGYYRTYTIRKEKPDCWWANGDAGNIWTFNPQTATKGCGTLSSGAPDFATIQLQDADKCTQTLLSWNKWEFLGMKPPTATFTSVNVTFFDSGNVPLPGFSNLQLPPPTPVVDLSSLSPAQTGNTLNVKVTFNGLTGCQSVSCSFTSRVTYKTTQQICCP